MYGALFAPAAFELDAAAAEPVALLLPVVVAVVPVLALDVVSPAEALVVISLPTLTGPAVWVAR